MPDPSSKAASLQQTYTLTVKLHDLMGDAPVDAATMAMQLVRTDEHRSEPLFGPQGLLLGGSTVTPILAVSRDATMISPGVYTYRLIPNDYYFVTTRYQLVVGGRRYPFTMPAEDTDLITILDGETPVAPVIPTTRGLFIAWVQASDTVTLLPGSSGDRVTNDIVAAHTALTLTTPPPALPGSYVYLAFPAALLSTFLALQLGSHTLHEADLDAATLMSDGVGYRFYVFNARWPGDRTILATLILSS